MSMEIVAPETVTSKVGELPPMPDAAAMVLKLLSEPDTTAEDLQRVIELDPGLTTSVLRLVNSALFHLPRQISTLSHAIMLLGFLRLRSLTLASIVAGLKGLIPPAAAHTRDTIWEHSVSVALAARALAAKAGLAWSEEAFVGGLLHDSGRLLLLAYDPEKYASLLRSSAGCLPSPEEEKELFGVDHQQLGGLLLTEWNLAPQLVSVVGQHHGAVTLEGPHAALTALVVGADRLMEADCSEEPPREALAVLGFDVDRMQPLAEEIREIVHEERGGLMSL